MPVILTVDAVLLTLVDEKLHVALFKRDRVPFEGQWALPGGYIHEQEDSDAQGAALRVLKDKTGIVPPYLEEFGIESGQTRDPRGWSLTVVFYALVPRESLPASVALAPVDALPALAFDHAKLVAAVVERVRNKSSYSSLPVFLCAEPFTIPDLHATYEAVLGEKQDMSSFRRKLEDMRLLEALEGQLRSTGRNRKAQLYRVSEPFRKRLSLRERVF